MCTPRNSSIIPTILADTAIFAAKAAWWVLRKIVVPSLAIVAIAGFRAGVLGARLVAAKMSKRNGSPIQPTQAGVTSLQEPDLTPLVLIAAAFTYWYLNQQASQSLTEENVHSKTRQ